jgi:alginate O-acetyltransferase complex protein AlgI
MMFSIFVNYWMARGMDSFNKKVFLALMVLFNVGVLFVFKYLVFFVRQINSFFDCSLSVPSIALPIGISFFTFQAMSYVVDVYRGEVPVQKSMMNLGLYISLFPQLIAGPIVRYHDIVGELHDRRVSVADFDDGVRRFVIGLAKKVLIANNVALVVDRVFGSDVATLSCLTAWLGAIGYTLQIYFDFSGYSDMAIGLGKMFGFHFLENFNYPYISKSVSEFWRRWHISLGRWFRDYVYFPLGGSRVDTTRRLMFNLFIVWLLTGIWHGANWTFIFWGLWYCAFICLEKGFNLEPWLQKSRIAGHFYTLLIAVIGWVFFRSDTLGQGLEFVKRMFFATSFVDGETTFLMHEYGIVLVLGIMLSTPCFRSEWVERCSQKSWIVRVGCVAIYLLILLLSLSYVIKSSYSPFIYFNF